MILPSSLARYRRRVLAGHRVASERACLRFVNAMGFCYAFTRGPGDLPGLFDVLATRSVGRMWDWAWTWKEELPRRKRLYYGKVIRHKPTYISLDCLPHFYALSGNVGEPDDCLVAYRAGRVTRLAKEIYEFLAARGRASTRDLRQFFDPEGNALGQRLQRALRELQEGFFIVKVDEVGDNPGNYAYVWDTFPRWLPAAVNRAGSITEAEAAAAVLERYLGIVGAAAEEEICDLWGWPAPLLQRALQRLGGRVATAQIRGRGPALCRQDLRTGL
ncbi:MAG: winged helix DNA-binding domain-containing protein [Armatimonadetes bacterium]|nr:winged helix DNA-binding domain-containing protein [Armatimonadota bacterium]